MKVIAAGLCKTGTKSLTEAFNRMNYNVYDYMENTVILGKDWVKIFKDGWTADDFRRMYKDVDVVIDIPCCYFWEEILKAFPDAKIILMIRDEDKWCKSISNQIRVMEASFMLRLLSLLSPSGRMAWHTMQKMMGVTIFGMTGIPLWKPFRWMHINEEMLKLKYRAHNAYVIHNAPKDKLLVFDCADGWEPLCKFLDVPVPDIPFPHENKGGSVIQQLFDVHPILKQMEKEMFISLGVIAAIVSVGGFLIIRSGPKNLWNSICSAVSGSVGKIFK